MHLRLRWSTARRTSAILMLQLVIGHYPLNAGTNIDFPDISAKLERYIDANPAVSMDIAVVHQDNVVFKSSFGPQPDKGDDHFQSIYRIGSITKIFTALAVMKLEDDGLIDIDQPVFAYLPRFSVKRRFSDTSPVTIRHLLTHHSGLPTNILKGQWSKDHFTTVVEQLRNEYMTYPPEFVYSYSNIAYSLLGSMIEEVSGQSYESYIEENILQPLGMQQTTFSADRIPARELVLPGDMKEIRDILPIRDTPAMGLYSSANDMARFLSMLVNQGVYGSKQIIHSAALEQMMERNNEHVSLDYDHQAGIGLMLNHCSFEQADHVIEHGGQTMHYASYFIAVPEFGIAATVPSNSRKSKKFIHEVTSELIAAALNKYYPDTNKQGPVTLAEKSREHEYKHEDVAVDNETGKPATYLTSSGLLTFQVDESDQCACIDEKRFDLVPVPDGWYAISKKDGTPKDDSVEFSPQNIDGQQVLAARKRDRAQRVGEYIPGKEIPASWKERLGDYQVENPDADFPISDVCLIEEDNILFLSYRMPLLSDKRIDIPLTPLDETQAITTGLGRGRGETVLVEQTAEGEYLLYSGYLVKKVLNN